MFFIIYFIMDIHNRQTTPYTKEYNMTYYLAIYKTSENDITKPYYCQ